jgi:hypothetical protein
MALRRFIALALLMALAGCDPKTDFSPVETEAYLVLMDQIAETKDGPPLTADVRLCVAIITGDDPDGRKTRREFVEQLRNDAPENFKLVTVAPISECVKGSFHRTRLNGKVATILFASNRDEKGRWEAGIICGALCGRGYYYLIDRTHGELIAKRVGEWLS